jgi:hypothetical protein
MSTRDHDGVVKGRRGVVHLISLGFILWFGGAGCAARKPPVPFAAPEVGVTSGHYVGSPLTGPVDRVLPAAAAAAAAGAKATDALAVRVTMLALDRVPGGPVGVAAASAARLVAVTRNGVPVQAEARLGRELRIVEGQTAEAFEKGAAAAAAAAAAGQSQSGNLQTAKVIDLTGALPGSVTGWVELVDASDEWVAGQPLHRSARLELYRPKGDDTGVQLALVTEDLLAAPASLDTTREKTEERKRSGREPAAAAATTAPVVAPPSVVRELILIDRPAFKRHDAFGLLLPVRADRAANSRVKAFAAFFELSEGSAAPDAAAHRQAYARCMEDLALSLKGARAATQPFREEANNPEWPGLLTGLDAMARPGTPRQAMLFLAAETDVEILEDLALLGDAAFREELAKKVVAKIGVPASVQTKEGLAWVLENASYELLSEQSAAGKLPAELSAVLAARAGEAGRHPGALDEGLKIAANRREFALRLIAENYIYLEDSSPASRVRAYDWLVARDRAPAGYDPLGPPRERRAALERAMAGASASPAAGTAAPAANVQRQGAAGGAP